jgi:putative transposase
MILVHRIALDPNNEQRTYFARACGTARFAYNWALSEWEKAYAAGDKLNEADLRKLLNSIKEEQFPWMLEVTKNAVQQAIKNLGRAFQNFFDKRAKYPKRKKKGKARDSFRADNGPDKLHPNAVAVDGYSIKLPVIGWIRMHEELRFDGRILSVTISREADRWFASISVEVDYVAPERVDTGVVGVDLGITTLATVASEDGVEKIDAPKPLKRLLGKLKRVQRSLSRKVKGSFNRAKAKTKLARLYARIKNIRMDALHKLTTKLVRNHRTIGIEDLNVSGMLRNHCLARAISDLGFGEFRRQLEYKAPMHGGTIVTVNRWFPSSKLCSGCGNHAGDMPLSIREWICAHCGEAHDRDANAAYNLRTAASSAVAACGERSSGRVGNDTTKLLSTKQELGFELVVSYS